MSVRGREREREKSEITMKHRRFFFFARIIIFIMTWFSPLDEDGNECLGGGGGEGGVTCNLKLDIACVQLYWTSSMANSTPSLHIIINTDILITLIHL